MTHAVEPFSLKDAPALIERLLPVQKLSAEAFKEQMAGSGKTLTALGSYWKGRKPLILNKACILGCLLPATSDPTRDLEIFEKLMGMDDESFAVRWKRRFKPKDILGSLSIAGLTDYFVFDPPGNIPASSPIDWSLPEYSSIKVRWRDNVAELDRRRLEAQMLPKTSYRSRVESSQRPEEVMSTIHDHIWGAVNSHLGTQASSFPELVEQLGIMRFGHRPRVADTFSGSGQIPFEAARLGCDVHASDLNPIACMLTWGAMTLVGGSDASRAQMVREQQDLCRFVQSEIDRLGIEIDGKGWSARVYLYCVEVRCPQTGWAVPLLPTRVISASKMAIAVLIPEPTKKRYKIEIRSGVTAAELGDAESGTVGRDGRYGDAFLVHTVGGKTHKTMLATLKGDQVDDAGNFSNRLRAWEKNDFAPSESDIFQERLYCVQWMRAKTDRKGFDYEFRSVTSGDLKREQVVATFLEEHLVKWQSRGWIPDMQIEVGGPPRYQGQDLIRARGWRFWHQAFTPRMLLVLNPA